MAGRDAPPALQAQLARFPTNGTPSACEEAIESQCGLFPSHDKDVIALAGR